MLSFYAAIAKVDRERHMVFGYASTETLDQQGEIVRIEALEAVLPEYMRFANIREMHQPSAVGIAEEAQIDEKGLWLGARVVDDRAWEKVTEGVYKGFSIGGRVTARDPQDRRVVTGVDLTEISLVDRPANPEAVFAMMKRAEGVLRPQPLSKWDCGIAAHRHLAKGEAITCMEQQMNVNRAAAAVQSADAMVKRLTDAVAKREYPTAERQAMTESGEALPDGSFPIKDRADLANAIDEIGRAKDRAQAKAHVIARAAALGATDMLPPHWQSGAEHQHAAASDGEIAKGLHIIACLAEVLDQILWLQRCAAGAEIDGDAGARLATWLDEGVALLRDIVATESEALLADADVETVGDAVEKLRVAKASESGRAWPVAIAAALRQSGFSQSSTRASQARRHELAAALEKLGMGGTLTKLYAGNSLAHAIGERDAAIDALEKITARVAPLIGEVGELKKRLAIVEAMPLPPRAVLGVFPVSKEDDRGGEVRNTIEARLATLPPGAERAGELLRHAYYQPNNGR
jgi:phage head maturation protease